MAEDGDSTRADEPKHGRDGRGDQDERDSDDEKAGVKLRGRGAQEAEVKILTLEHTDAPDAADDEDDDEEEAQVGEQAVDAEHDEEGGIVAAEIAKVVVDAALGLAKVCRLGDALEVEEFA